MGLEGLMKAFQSHPPIHSLQTALKPEGDQPPLQEKMIYLPPYEPQMLKAGISNWQKISGNVKKKDRRSFACLFSLYRNGYLFCSRLYCLGSSLFSRRLR